MEATIVDGNGTETGHIIVTTIGGQNGQPKQVMCHLVICVSLLSWSDAALSCNLLGQNDPPAQHIEQAKF